MSKEKKHIVIVGAGLAGLTAARYLEQQGHSSTVIDAKKKVGGRLYTTVKDGYQLDEGFQVLLTGYPALKKYIDLETLNIQKLKPGAVIFNNGRQQKIGDPLRDFSLLFPTIFSNVGSFKDKLKILNLNLVLKKKSLDDIFTTQETTTRSYLVDKGFSEKIIANFFKPFFSGIFLEPNLETSSRMFEFVYKMFGEGYAVIPQSGIQSAPQQLADQLKETKFHLNTKVKEVTGDTVYFENGEHLKADAVIIATEASTIVKNLNNQAIVWKQSHTLYFETESRAFNEPMIGLIADKEAIINNIFYHTSVHTSTRGIGELLSVTVVKDTSLTAELLKEQVIDELKKYCGITISKFIEHCQIKKALPVVSNTQYTIHHTESRLTDTIFLAGDTLLNGSQNAAILSGEAAAKGAIEFLENDIIT